ncbi:hypothetical protein Bbelb_097230 [Branchiostoma belcheri]|nr:hypothetical protein Bbelb_097230 [Branchiostoma belcheri]
MPARAVPVRTSSGWHWRLSGEKAHLTRYLVRITNARGKLFQQSPCVFYQPGMSPYHSGEDCVKYSVFAPKPARRDRTIGAFDVTMSFDLATCDIDYAFSFPPSLPFSRLCPLSLSVTTANTGAARATGEPYTSPALPLLYPNSSPDVSRFTQRASTVNTWSRFTCPLSPAQLRCTTCGITCLTTCDCLLSVGYKELSPDSVISTGVKGQGDTEDCSDQSRPLSAREVTKTPVDPEDACGGLLKPHCRLCLPATPCPNVVCVARRPGSLVRPSSAAGNRL